MIDMIWYDMMIWYMIWYVERSNSEGDLKADLPLCFIFQANSFLWWFYSCDQIIMIMNYDYDEFTLFDEFLKLKIFISYSMNALI